MMRKILIALLVAVLGLSMAAWTPMPPFGPYSPDQGPGKVSLVNGPLTSKASSVSGPFTGKASPVSGLLTGKVSLISGSPYTGNLAGGRENHPLFGNSTGSCGPSVGSIASVFGGVSTASAPGYYTGPGGTGGMEAGLSGDSLCGASNITNSNALSVISARESGK